jgi:hypothetical protein
MMIALPCDASRRNDLGEAVSSPRHHYLHSGLGNGYALAGSITPT